MSRPLIDSLILLWVPLEMTGIRVHNKLIKIYTFREDDGQWCWRRIGYDRRWKFGLRSNTVCFFYNIDGSCSFKVEKILKGSLDSIPSASPSVKIQIMDRKVCLRCKGKTLLGVVNKLLKTKSLLTSPSNVLPFYLK